MDDMFSFEMLGPESEEEEELSENIESNSFSTCRKFWESFDIENRCLTMQSTSEIIMQNKIECKNSRSILAKETKEFCESRDDPRNLLRMYVKEVDTLTKRANDAEDHYLNIVKLLLHAPCPSQLLEIGESMLQRVKEQDVLIEEMRLKKDNGFVVDLQTQISSLEVELRTMEQRARDAEDQVLVLTQQIDDESAASQSEIRMLANEVERLQHLGSEMKTASVDGLVEESEESNKHFKDLEERLQRQMERSKEYKQDMEKTVKILSDKVEKAEEKCALAQEKLNESRKKFKEMQRELEKRPKVDEVHRLTRRLRLLQAINVDDENAVLDEKIESPNEEAEVVYVENIIREKLGKIQTRCATLEKELQCCKSKLSAMNKKCEITEERLSDSRSLVSQLEKENQILSNSKGEVHTKSKNEKNSFANFLSETNDKNEKDVQSTSMVGILSGQRDRLRNRVLELEALMDNETSKRLLAESETKKMRKKMTELSEKVVYLSSYQSSRKKRTRKNRFLLPNDNPKYDPESLGELAANEIYNDPFKQFKRKQRQIQTRKMNATDRVTFELGRIFFLSPQARRFLFFYVVILHLLVFYTLFYTLIHFDSHHGSHSSHSAAYSRRQELHMRNIGKFE
eukprot:g4825.t1